MQNLPPSVMVPHLKRLDESLLEMMEVATRLNCLSGESLDPLILRRVRMPVRKRGAGLRSQEWVAPMAFAGGFLHAIPAVASMCPALGAWLHGPHFHDPAHRADRLAFFTEQSESPLRESFTAAWNVMRERAGNPAPGADDPRPLDYPVKSAGFCEGKLIKEKFQREFTRQIEDVLFRQLKSDFKALDWKDMRSAAFFVVDNYSRQFINALPLMDTWCLGDELAEMYATYFGVPSPACAQYVGRRVGTREGSSLDAYGHALTSTTGLQGNNVKARHDHLKWVIGRVMEVLHVTVEASGLFNDLIHDPRYWQQSKSDRQRQGICPDFATPAGEGNRGTDRGTLFELKTFSMSATGPGTGSRYKTKVSVRNSRHATNLRGRGIQSEYVRKARKADQKWCGTPVGTQGPIERRLLQYGAVFGLTVGGFGEVNDNMDELVSLCATRAAESKWRLMGADNLAQAVQTFKARIRRSIGVEGARGLARLRLANLVHVHSFNRGSLSSCQLRQREKAYYYDARETHYNRFGPHAWFDPSMRGRSTHHC